jgi:two-component system, cell cycle sensor histidine kinase and response regulator CckA
VHLENGPNARSREESRITAMTRHILVVEDDEAYSRVVKRMLEAAGFQVTTASNFATALPIIEGTALVDLMLADINMPIGTPHGLSIGLMAESKRHNLKIIYMSGSVDPAQIARFAPHAKLLRKPFSAQELLQAIKTAFGDA